MKNSHFKKPDKNNLYGYYFCIDYNDETTRFTFVCTLCQKKIITCDSRTLNNIVSERKLCTCSKKKIKESSGGFFITDKGLDTILNSYIKGANARNKSFDLTREQVRTLVQSPCHYCGKGPSNTIRNDSTKYNGIDRANNNQGYVMGNCVSCCKRCNLAKGTMGYTEFRTFVSDVYNFWALG